MQKFTKKQAAFLKALTNPAKPLKLLMKEIAVTPRHLARWSASDKFMAAVDAARHVMVLQRTLAVEIDATLTAGNLHTPKTKNSSAARQRLDLDLASLFHKPLPPKEKPQSGLDLVHPNFRADAPALIRILESPALLPGDAKE